MGGGSGAGGVGGAVSGAKSGSWDSSSMEIPEGFGSFEGGEATRSGTVGGTAVSGGGQGRLSPNGGFGGGAGPSGTALELGGGFPCSTANS